MRSGSNRERGGGREGRRKQGAGTLHVALLFFILVNFLWKENIWLVEWRMIRPRSACYVARGLLNGALFLFFCFYFVSLWFRIDLFFFLFLFFCLLLSYFAFLFCILLFMGYDNRLPDSEGRFFLLLSSSALLFSCAAWLFFNVGGEPFGYLLLVPNFGRFDSVWFGLAWSGSACIGLAWPDLVGLTSARIFFLFCGSLPFAAVLLWLMVRCVVLVVGSFFFFLFSTAQVYAAVLSPHTVRDDCYMLIPVSTTYLVYNRREWTYRYRNKTPCMPCMHASSGVSLVPCFFLFFLLFLSSFFLACFLFGNQRKALNLAA